MNATDMTDVPSAKVASLLSVERWWLATDTPATKLLGIYLRGITAFCWAATRGAFGRMLLTRLQMIIHYLWRSLVAQRREQRCIINGPATNEGIQDNVTTLALPTPQNTFPKKIYWSYFRGVSLALSELCQDCNYGGNPIPLSAILDLMRQHQSAFVPLGPHMEKDVPKRLIELANKHVVFFDPFEEYVIVPEGTREKYALRRQELLAEGVDSANLNVFGVALTAGLSPSKRITTTGVVSYKERFLLDQQKKKEGKFNALTREKSLMSIADAVCLTEFWKPDIIEVNPIKGDDNNDNEGTRRGHSIVMDIAKIVVGLRDGGRVLRRGPSVLSEVSAIIHQRDALEVENNRLRTTFEREVD